MALDQAQQNQLKEKLFNRIKEIENIDNENRKKYSLTQFLIACNKQSYRQLDLGSYITFFNAAGAPEDFTGANLVANWYKRNLRMYSFVQKQSTADNDKILILLGAGHASLFKHFIDLDENFKSVELAEILEM